MSLSMNMPENVANIIRILRKNGHAAYAVGGCVRDTILNREPNDWDITTSALPQQVKELFSRTIDTGIKHGTVTIMMKKVGYEVTTFRIDGEYEDSRHPKSVEFTSDIVEDLKRRDFTINAMAYNKEDGIVDVFGGIDDINKKIIRCVGNPEERFTEDALRILRAVRFAAQLGFAIEENTLSAMKKLSGNLKNISGERIRVELDKLLISKNPDMIRICYETGITKVILPEFDKMMETEQNCEHHIYSVGEHTIRVLMNIRQDRYLRWAALLHDVSKPDTKTTDKEGKDHFFGHSERGYEVSRIILKRLKFDNKTVDTVSRLVKCHSYQLGDNIRSVRRSMIKVGTDIYEGLLELKIADASGKIESDYIEVQNNIKKVQELYNEVIENTNCLAISDLKVKGADLMSIGITEGKKIGETFNKLLDMVIDEPELNTKEKLLEIAEYLNKGTHTID